jgi:hypothetical protein
MPIVEVAGGSHLPTPGPVAIIHPTDGEPFVLSVGFSGIGELFASPDPDTLCVVERYGRVVLVNVQTREQRDQGTLDPVHIAASNDHGLLLVAAPNSITALAVDGIRWAARGLVSDDLHITRSDGDRIYFRGLGSNYIDEVRGSLDAQSGEVL